MNEPTDEQRIYPCAACETMMSKDEGGTVFSICEKCWDKHYRNGLEKQDDKT